MKQNLKLFRVKNAKYQIKCSNFTFAYNEKIWALCLLISLNKNPIFLKANLRLNTSFR